MTKENSEKKYQKGDQIWFIERSHCPHDGERPGQPPCADCPACPPCVETATVASVVREGVYYGKSGGGIIAAEDIYPTPEAARRDIPDGWGAKVRGLKRRIAELEDELEVEADSSRKWCPLMEDTACKHEHCGWYDTPRGQCSAVTVASLKSELRNIGDSLPSIAGMEAK